MNMLTKGQIREKGKDDRSRYSHLTHPEHGEKLWLHRDFRESQSQSSMPLRLTLRLTLMLTPKKM
jgi:hypothetical protein